jgi:hypothetical protein
LPAGRRRAWRWRRGRRDEETKDEYKVPLPGGVRGGFWETDEVTEGRKTKGRRDGKTKGRVKQRIVIKESW